MIVFQCGGCGKGFKVPDESAGKKGRCKQCGASITVPDVFPVLEVDPPTIRPSVSPYPTPGPPLDLDPLRPTAPKKPAPRPRGVSPLGVASFTLGSAGLVWAGSEGYHPPAWSVTKLALTLGVVALFASLASRRTRTGWPVAGILASLLGLGFCRGMEQRELRAAYADAYRRTLEIEQLARFQANQRIMEPADVTPEVPEDEMIPAPGGPRIPTKADVGRSGYLEFGEGGDAAFLCDSLGPDGLFDREPSREVRNGTRILILTVEGLYVRVRYNDEEFNPHMAWTTLDWIRIEDESKD